MTDHEGTVEANGVNLTYRQQGAGPALVAIMGLGGQLTDWPQGLIDQFAQHFTVFTFDNRDIGLSTEFTSEPLPRTAFLKARLTRQDINAEYTLIDMAADTAALMDALDLPAAHVMGLSMGGMIAQNLAIIHPRRVLSLTSIMSHTGDAKNGSTDPMVMMKLSRMQEPTRATALQSALDQFQLFAGSSWDADEHRRRQAASIERSFRPAGAARQLAAIMASPDRTSELRKLDVPTLVIHGLEDKLVRPTGGIATAMAVPGSRLLMFPDMGHDLPVNRWTEIIDAVLANTQRGGASLG